MKKSYKNIVFSFLLGLMGLSSTLNAHSVQVGYCVSCDGILRVYVEHWHGDAVGATTMDIELDVGGVVTTVTGQPAGFISDTVITDLPNCATPITVFGDCPPAIPPTAPVCGNFLCEDGEDLTCPGDCPLGPPVPVSGQCGANTCNYWVVYDFPTIQKGVPITITILSGNNQFTEDGCSMFPAVTPVFTIPLSILPTIDIAQTVCTGTSANINLADFTGNLQWQSSSASGGPWTDMPGATVTPLSTANIASKMFFQAVVTGECGVSISPETIVDVSQGVASDAGVDISACPTATPGNLGAPPALGATYSWSPATGLNSVTVANPTVDLSSIMNITYTVTTATPGCASTTDEVSVVVTNDLTVSVSSPELCFGETATITASGATTYSWSPATDLNTATGATVICSAPGSTSYTVTGTSNGCVGTAVSTVTMNPTPSSNAGADISICSGETGTIGAASTPGYIYSWNPATDLSSSTAADPTVTPTNFTAAPITLTYIVTTSPAGCFSTDAVDVTVNPAVDPTFNYSGSTFCQVAGAADPSPTITAAGGAFTFTPAGLIIDGASGLVTIATSTLGTYTVTYTQSGPCPSSSSGVITITNSPDAQFSFGEYCQNVANPLPLFPAGASAGVFSSAAGLNFVSTSSGEIDLAGSTAGNYTITNTIAAGGGCPNAVKTNTITVNAVPVTTIDNPIICIGDAGTFTAGGADSYVWSDLSSAGTLVVSPPASTNYTVTGTTAGCSSDAVGAITVNTLPIVGVNDATVCVGVMAALVATGADTYSWSDDASTSANKLVLPTAIGVTTYTVTGTTTNCQSTAVATVTVITAPAVIVNSEPICSGSSATLIGSGATTYAWSDGSSSDNIIVSPTITTTYTVTGSSGGCSADAIATVSVNPVPTSPFTVTTVCVDEGSSIVYTGNAPSNATYTWDFGTGTIISGTGQGPYSVSWPTAGTYNVTLDVSIGACGSLVVTTMPVTVNTIPTVAASSIAICTGLAGTITPTGAATYVWTDGTQTFPITATGVLTDSPTALTSYTVTGTSANGCVGTEIVTIDVNPLPIVGIIPDSLCEGLPATMTGTGAITYVWSTGSSTNPLIVTPNVTTPYTVIGTDANGCENTYTAEAKIYPKPIAQYSTAPSPTGFYDPEITFRNQSSRDATTWEWDFGDGDSLSSTSSVGPVHEYVGDTATYLTSLKIGNPGGCFDSITHLVIIGPEYSLYIPNAFSPNGDSKNEMFLAMADEAGLKEFSMMIYDRWGNFIFYTSDIETGWNGDNSGVPAQEDVYVYTIDVVDHSGKEHSYRGTVSLIR